MGAHDLGVDVDDVVQVFGELHGVEAREAGRCAEGCRLSSKRPAPEQLVAMQLRPSSTGRRARAAIDPAITPPVAIEMTTVSRGGQRCHCRSASSEDGGQRRPISWRHERGATQSGHPSCCG